LREEPAFFALFFLHSERGSMSGTFKDLKSWQRAFDLALDIYGVTRSFPREEMYGLTSQLRRAAVSVVSNIAEGKGRASDKDLLRFLGNAKGSLFELETQVALSERLSYMTDADAMRVIAKITETGKLISGLMRALTPTAPPKIIGMNSQA
jgi:four helix bundle protein